MSLCDLLLNIHSHYQPSGQTGIEHYGSMSRTDRADFTVATDASQRAPVASQATIVLNAAKDGVITLPNLLTARRLIWDNTYKAIPAAERDALKNTEQIIAAAETCLFIRALSGNSNGGNMQITKDYATSILLHEQFPPGWKPATTPMGVPQLLECLLAQGYDWAKQEAIGIIELARHWLDFGIKI